MIFILNIYRYKKDRNATQCDECENRMAAKKGQGLVRTALNQGYRTLLVLNVPKRLGKGQVGSSSQTSERTWRASAVLANRPLIEWPEFEGRLSPA